MREGLPPPPPNIAKLPLDDRGYPVPWFVYIDPEGKADFRIIGPSKIVSAIRHNLCWVCGKQLGRVKAFVVGPMCAVNRTSAEPPSHLECAVWSACACPFLTRPRMRRNPKGLPENAKDFVPGMMLDRNPGVTLVWGCLRYSYFAPDDRGLLFTMGPPNRLQWFCEGRPATRAEVLYSIDTGLPFLRAEAEKDGPFALAELDAYLARTMQLLPKEQAA